MSPTRALYGYNMSYYAISWYNLCENIISEHETKVVIEDTLYGNSITSLCECVHVSVYVCVVCVSVSNGSQWLGVYRLACTFRNRHGILFHI